MSISCVSPSESFLERPQINLLRLGRTRLAMDVPVVLGNLVNLGRGPPGDEHVMAALREPPAQRCAEPAFGADPDNDRSRFAHLLLAFDVDLRLAAVRFRASSTAPYRWRVRGPAAGPAANV